MFARFLPSRHSARGDPIIGLPLFNRVSDELYKSQYNQVVSTKIVSGASAAGAGVEAYTPDKDIEINCQF